MLNRFADVTGPAQLRRVAREQKPAIVLLLVAFFAGASLICAGLIAPILWAAVTEDPLRPKVTYQKCGTIKEEASRLACYDAVFRWISNASGRNGY
jgi:hypothetical protein